MASGWSARDARRRFVARKPDGALSYRLLIAPAHTLLRSFRRDNVGMQHLAVTPTRLAELKPLIELLAEALLRRIEGQQIKQAKSLNEQYSDQSESPIRSGGSDA
jgi:hypothetical protein